MIRQFVPSWLKLIFFFAIVKWKISNSSAILFLFIIYRSSRLHISCLENLEKFSVAYREWFILVKQEPIGKRVVIFFNLIWLGFLGGRFQFL